MHRTPREAKAVYGRTCHTQTVSVTEVVINIKPADQDAAAAIIMLVN